jgi:hypothetical protein
MTRRRVGGTMNVMGRTGEKLPYAEGSVRHIKA